MQEEIFGPVMPILTYDRFEDLFGLLSDKQKHRGQKNMDGPAHALPALQRFQL